MSTRDRKEYAIYTAVTPQTITSSTDATPIVVTKASHGFSTGDLVVIYGHTTNIAANGIRKVTVLSSSTFSLQDPYTNADIAGSGAGAGSSGIMCVAPKIVLHEDFRDMIIQAGTTGTATLTLKVAGSLGNADGSAPNFGGTVTPTNAYTFLQIINLDTAAAVNGATGIAASGADLQNTYEVNTNGMKYITLIPTAWTQGAFTVKVICFSGD